MEGHGAPLVFQHGFGDSLESWYELGYVEALIAQRMQRKEPLGFDDILPTLFIPSLLMVGESNAAYARVKGCSRLIPNATFVSFPSRGHTGSILNRAGVISHMQQFLRGPAVG